jgi:hypothetical protein
VDGGGGGLVRRLRPLARRVGRALLRGHLGLRALAFGEGLAGGLLCLLERTGELGKRGGGDSAGLAIDAEGADQPFGTAGERARRRPLPTAGAERDLRRRADGLALLGQRQAQRPPRAGRRVQRTRISLRYLEAEAGYEAQLSPAGR